MGMSVGVLDHFNIRTRKLDETVRFYQDILGLEKGARPNFAFPGAWMYSEGKPVVHLVDISKTDEPQKPDSGVVHHVAFASQGFAGMKQRGWGRIINIASAHGLIASPFKAAYVAAKHGVVGLTKVTALEGAESGVTCNAICPGYVWTPLVEKQIDDQAKSHGIGKDRVIREILLAQQPNKKFATVEELGALCLFLSTDAGASITGTALPVDGGWTAH